MTTGGWGVDNLHLIFDLVKVATLEYVHGNKPSPTPTEIRAYYESMADHLINDGTAVTGDQLSAHFEQAMLTSHNMVEAHRAKALLQDPNVQFKAYMPRLRDVM